MHRSFPGKCSNPPAWAIFGSANLSNSIGKGHQRHDVESSIVFVGDVIAKFTHTKRLKFPSKNLLARKNHPIFSTKKISTNTTRGKNPSIATLELWKLRHLLEIHCGFTSALHPGKFTWNLQISQLKRTVIFQTSVFGFHDHFPGCT